MKILMVKAGFIRLNLSNWIAETNSYYLAEEAIAWSKKELERFKDFLAASMKKYSPETSMLILAGWR